MDRNNYNENDDDDIETNPIKASLNNIDARF